MNKIYINDIFTIEELDWFNIPKEIVWLIEEPKHKTFLAINQSKLVKVEIYAEYNSFPIWE